MWFLLTAFLSYHTIYISVTELTYSDETNEMGIRVKVFTNDLEDGIYNLTNTSASLRTPNALLAHQSQIALYLNDRLNIKIDGIQTSIEVMGAEKENDATWISGRISDVRLKEKMELSNQILTELFSSQTNVVTIIIDGEKRFLRFSKSTPPQTISLTP